MINGGVVSADTRETFIVVLFEYHKLSTATKVSSLFHVTFHKSAEITSVTSADFQLKSFDQITLSFILIVTLFTLFGACTLNQTIGLLDIS
jgi:hypothetical protein